MSLFDGLLATDEDLFVKSPADFDLLIPRSQCVAAGPDGVLVGWTLTTDTGDLSGLESGHVVLLSVIGRSWLDGLGVAESTESDLGGPVTLRRIGLPAGVGPTPQSPGGVQVSYRAPTARPQIAVATESILRRFGYADTSSILDPADFKAVVVLLVLIDLLAAQHHEGGGDSAGKENLHVKLGDAKAERDRELNRLNLLHSPATPQLSRVPAVGQMNDLWGWRVPPRW